MLAIAQLKPHTNGVNNDRAIYFCMLLWSLISTQAITLQTLTKYTFDLNFLWMVSFAIAISHQLLNIHMVILHVYQSILNSQYSLLTHVIDYEQNVISNAIMLIVLHFPLSVRTIQFCPWQLQFDLS